MKKLTTIFLTAIIGMMVVYAVPLHAQVYKTRDGQLIVFNKETDRHVKVKFVNSKLDNEKYEWPTSSSAFIQKYREAELIFGSPVPLTDETLASMYSKMEKEPTSTSAIYVHPTMLIALGQAAYIPGGITPAEIQIEKTGADKKTSTVTLAPVEHRISKNTLVKYEQKPSDNTDIVLKLNIPNGHWVDSARVYKKVVGSHDSTLVKPIVYTTIFAEYTLMQVWDTVKVVGEFIYTIQPHDKLGLWHDPLPGIYAHNYTQQTEPRFTEFTTEVANETKTIQLKWETSFPLRVRGFDVYRSASHEGPFIKISSLGADERSYIDHVKGTMQEFFYYIQVIDQKGIGAKSITQFVIPKAQEKPMPPHAVLASPVPGGVEITWSTFDAFHHVHGYYVYRQENEKADWVQLTTFLLRKGESMAWRDTSSFLDPTIQYAYAVKAESTSYLLSDFSTPSYARPQKPRVIMAPQQVEHRMLENSTVILYWKDLRMQDPYITKYHVYETDASGKILSEVSGSPIESVFTTWQQPETARMANGYAVQAEDMWGNKSAHTKISFPQIQNESIAPVNLLAKPSATGHMLSWGQPSSPTVKSVELYKVKPDGKSSILVKSLKPDVKTYSITDMKPGQVETYYITYKMANGNESERSEVVMISK